jgi:two-component system sensor histidine kinase AgrC
MKKRIIISNEIFLIIIIIIISLCLIAMLVKVVGVAKEISSWEKDFQWEESLVKETENGERVTIYQIHISKNPKDQILYCQGKFQFASIWVNGSFVGDYPGDRSTGENLGLWEAMIPLPEGDVTIRFEVMSPYAIYDGMGLKSYLVSQQEINNYLLFQSLYRVSFTTAGVLIGIFFIIISISARISYSSDLSLMFFGIFTITYFLFILVHEANPDHLLCALFTPKTLGNVSLFLFYFMLIPNITMITIKSMHFTIINRIILAAVIIFVIITSGAQLIGIKMLPEFLPLRQILVLSYSTFYCVSTLIEYKRGNRFAIWLFVWISSTTIAYIFDVFGLFKKVGLPDIRISYIVISILTILVFANSVAGYIKKIVYEKTEIHRIALRNQMALERYENAKTYMEQLKQVKHEIKNHLIMLRIILDQGNIEKAKDYIRELAQEEECYKTILYSENYLVDGIIGSAAMRMDKSNIRFYYDIVLPSEIHFSEKKLNSFLMNLLDNAIESCCRIVEEEKRFIRLTMKIVEPYLYIHCSNSKGNKVIKDSGQYITSKLDKSNHGYGLKIMKQIAEQSGGMLEIKEKDEIFELNAIIKLADKKN